MEINKYDKPKKFTDKELEAIAQKRIEFLRKIYPFLKSNNYSDGCIELRPIYRSTSEKKYVKSYNAWHMNKEDVKNLLKFQKEINGETFCLYYSVYAFDYHKKIINKEKSTPDKIVYRHSWEINKENALFTTILTADFDNISIEEYEYKYKKMFLNVGIDTIDIFSGHGVQVIILLDKKYYDKELLKKFVQTLFSKGFDIDTSTNDCARIMRMILGFNCKEFGDSKILDPKAIVTFPFHDTNKRYSAVKVFQALNTLPDIIPPSTEIKDMNKVINELKAAPAKAFVNKIEKAEKQKINENKVINQVEFKDFEKIQKEYPLNFNALESPIKKMLCGTPDGLRNAAIMFLVPFLKNALKVSLEQATEIFKTWDTHCVPPNGNIITEETVRRLWHKKYDKKFGSYPCELKKYYGEMNFDSYKLDNFILIPNKIFNNLKEISDTALNIYLNMLLDNKINDKKEWTIDEITKCSEISKRTFFNNIKDLIKSGFVDKSKENIYKINAYKFCVGDGGYLKIEILSIKTILKELNNPEIKLYLFLRYIILSNKSSECFASQEWIGERIGKTRIAITNLTTSLTKKKYIRKTTEKDGFLMHSNYVLY